MRDLAKITIFSGIPFGAFMSLIFGLSLYLSDGIAKCSRYYSCLTLSAGLGLICGILFGIFMSLAIRAISRQRYIVFGARNPCEPGENLIKRGEAVHIPRWQGVGGYLYLTDKRLLFLAESTSYGNGNCELSIPLGEIVSIRRTLTSGLVPNGLEIVTDLRKDRFALKERVNWLERIQEVRKQDVPNTSNNVL